MAHDPDRACPHENFRADVVVNRLGEADPGNDTGRPNHYSADIRVRCNACDEPFRWIGVPGGLSPAQPRCSVDETELRAPLRPASSDPDFGLGFPGFAVAGVVSAGQELLVEGVGGVDEGGAVGA